MIKSLMDNSPGPKLMRVHYPHIYKFIAHIHHARIFELGLVGIRGRMDGSVRQALSGLLNQATDGSVLRVLLLFFGITP